MAASLPDRAVSRHPQRQADRVAAGQLTRQELQRVVQAVDGDGLAEQGGGRT